MEIGTETWDTSEEHFTQTVSEQLHTWSEVSRKSKVM